MGVSPREHFVAKEHYDDDERDIEKVIIKANAKIGGAI